MNISDAIHAAIDNKNIIECVYDGRTRICEPHVFGIKNGKLILLVYQIGGQSSSGRIPDWRLLKINKIRDFHILNETFPGKRHSPSGHHTNFDTILTLVD